MARAPFENFPFIIGWELTLACNLRCRHCGSSAGCCREGELSASEALSICEQFPDLLVQEVDFTGGEPLMCPYWSLLAVRLQQLGIATKIITNGVLLSPELAREIRAAGVRGVGISIDGMEETHDSLRCRPDLYRHIMKAAGWLCAEGVPLTILTTVSGKNVEQLPQLLPVVERTGAKYWQLQPVFRFGRAYSDPELQLSDNQYLRLGEFVRDFGNEQRASGLEIVAADSFGYFTDLDRREPPWGGCPAGRIGCGITSDGRVKGCLSLPDQLSEGDLRNRSLWDIWFDENSFSYTRGFQMARLGPNCEGCAMGEKCRGGCTAMSYSCTGRFNNDPYCFSRLLARTAENQVWNAGRL